MAKTTKYDVRRVTDMRGGLTAKIAKHRGVTHYVCRWNSDGTQNTPVAEYRSYEEAAAAANECNSINRDPRPQ